VSALRTNSLTWLPVDEGVCTCGRRGRRFAALEQENRNLAPICATCMQEVEDLISRRREAKGVQCYRCNRSDALKFKRVLGRPVWACPACLDHDDLNGTIMLRLEAKAPYPLPRRRLLPVLGFPRHCETDAPNAQCPYIALGCRGCSTRVIEESAYIHAFPQEVMIRDQGAK